MKNSRKGELDGNSNNNSSNRIAFSFILGIIILAVVFPFFMEYVVLRNNVVSVLTNSDWSAFLGSFVGGAIGGIGTLLAVYLTTQDSKKSFHYTKKNIDYDRKVNQYNEQKKFTDDIAMCIAEFSTDIFYYALAISRYKVVENEKNNMFEREKKLRSRISSLQANQIGRGSKLNSKELDIDQKRLNEIQAEVKALSEKLDKRLNNIKRTVASNNYFLLKVKLSGIESANNLLILLDDIYENTSLNSEYDLTWINNKIVQLQECTHNYIKTNLKSYEV